MIQMLQSSITFTLHNLQIISNNHARLTFTSFKVEQSQRCKPSDGINKLQICFKWCFKYASDATIRYSQTTADVLQMLKEYKLLQTTFRFTATNYMITCKIASLITFNSFKCEPNQCFRPSSCIKQLQLCYTCFSKA